MTTQMMKNVTDGMVNLDAVIVVIVEWTYALTNAQMEVGLLMVKRTKGDIMLEIQKCYSIDGESFNLDSMSDVLDRIEDNLDEGETAIGKKYWKADATPVLHKHIITDDDIIHFPEILDEQFDEFIEDPDSVYSDVPKEAITELKDIVLAWAGRYVPEGRYYGVKNVQELDIEQADIETI
jgi:hypothetical protein